MAEDFDSVLNSDDVRKRRDKTPGLPLVDGDFDVTVLVFKDVPNEETGRKFIAEFVVDKSTHDLVLPKNRYCLIWSTGGFKGAMKMAAESLRPFFAACENQDTHSPDFNPIPIKQAYLAASTAGEPIESKIRISRRKGKKPSKTKKNEDGSPKFYYDDTFTALGGE